MAAILAEHLQTVLESALTGLEMDQSRNTFAALLTYRSALSCLTYCTDSLLNEQHPMVWLEACRQVQVVLEDRIQARESLRLTVRLHACHVTLHEDADEHSSTALRPCHGVGSCLAQVTAAKLAAWTYGCVLPASARWF